MKGLTSKQAEKLLATYGKNALDEHKKEGFITKLIAQCNNFLTILLIIAAVLSFFIGEAVDGGLILFIVILNALFGLYQEAKAEESLAALKKMSVSKVRVVRDDKQVEIESTYLVPGDVVFLEEGSKVPADGIIVESMNMEVNESMLTGESLPIPKQIRDELFSGTIISKGRGYLHVQKTGMKTKFGAIAKNLTLIEDGKTPLQKKLEGLTRTIGIVGIVAAFCVFIISLMQGGTYFPAFLLAISLAVAVVPEGLPAVMTITLAIGVKEMAKKKSVVRKLSAIEALGSITLIATDKTGTITSNKMKVKELFVNNKLQIAHHKWIRQAHHIPSEIEGSNQIIEIQNREKDPFQLLLLDGILCSTASLVYKHDHGSYDVLGDPTEGALLYLAQEKGVSWEKVRNNWKTVEEMPFDSVSKRMSVLVSPYPSSNISHPTSYVFSKGAPESILEISSSVLIDGKVVQLDEKEKTRIETQMREWAKKGLRVLAFSYKQLNQSSQSESVASGKNTDSTDLTNLTDSTFLGMVAIHDAPRPEVIDAVKRAKTAGIKIVMITGDNEKTAEAIGVSTGIIMEGEDILTGQQVESYSDKALLAVLPRVRIFARTSPFQKHRIVKLLQELGEVVAVTGDGVNDAIALKQADVGVAMGLVGTDVARETADMVITDDNFASIVNAVEEGRNIIKNLKNAIKYLLSCNISEAIALIVGLLLGFDHIFFPIQFLYINLVTDGFPALALSFSPRNKNLMHEPPAKELKLLTILEQWYILLVGCVTSILVLGSYYIFREYLQADLATAAAFSVLTLTQSFIFIDLWLSHQSFHRNLFKLHSPLFYLAFLFPFLAQYIIVHQQFIASIFKINAVSFSHYVFFCFISSLVFVGIKGVKKLVKIGLP